MKKLFSGLLAAAARAFRVRCFSNVIGGSNLALATALLLVPGPVEAQVDRWDSTLQDSFWYVPAENLLAYLTVGNDLSNVIPVADQTLWAIGDAQNGVFSGDSVAKFVIGPVSSTSSNSMDGFVSEAGQIRIVFTSTTGGPTTVGIGQMREINGSTAMEMQMISGADGSYLTHWAYMLSYDGNPDNLPNLEIEKTLRSEEWTWMKGTSWMLQSASLFGPGTTAEFEVDDYFNGYFWGSGTGGGEDFTLLGSSTPEGNVLFSLLLEGELISLTGLLTGDPGQAQMALRTYDPQTGFGDASVATLIPEPSPTLLVLLSLLAVMLNRRRLFHA